METKVDVFGFLDSQISSAKSLSGDAFYAALALKLASVRGAVADLVAAHEAIAALSPAPTPRVEAEFFGKAQELSRTALARITPAAQESEP